MVPGIPVTGKTYLCYDSAYPKRMNIKIDQNRLVIADVKIKLTKHKKSGQVLRHFDVSKLQKDLAMQLRF